MGEDTISTDYLGARFHRQIACAKLRALRDREQEIVELKIQKCLCEINKTKSKKVKILDFHPISQ
jgi:hypothetical protein